MWGFLSRVSSQVGEVLAPMVRTRLDDFKDHWRGIRSFYIDKKEDVEEGKIPQHLNSMIELLLEEEDQQLDERDEEEMGECMDFFVRNRVLEFLCTVAMKDVPKGIKKLIIIGITTLLRNIQQPLLPHQAIHQPIATLFGVLLQNLSINPQISEAAKSLDGVGIELPENERDISEELIALIDIVIQQLIENPKLINYFVEPDTDNLQRQNQMPVKNSSEVASFLGSIETAPVFHKLAKTRFPLLELLALHTGFSNLHFTSHSWEQSHAAASSSSSSQSPSEGQTTYSLAFDGSKLTQLQSKERARITLFNGLLLAPYLSQALQKNMNGFLIPLLIRSISNGYNLTRKYLSKKLIVSEGPQILLIDSQTPPSRSHFQEIVHDIRALVASEWKLVDLFLTKPFLASQLVVGIEDELLVDLVGKDLAFSSSQPGSFSLETLTALLYMREYLSTVQSPLLLRSLSNFVFGRDSQPEIIPSSGSQSQDIRNVFFDLLSSKNRDFLLLVLDVFDGFLKTLDPEIIGSLVGRNTRALSFLLRQPLSHTDSGLQFTLNKSTLEASPSLSSLDKTALVHASMIDFLEIVGMDVTSMVKELEGNLHDNGKLMEIVQESGQKWRDLLSSDPISIPAPLSQKTDNFFEGRFLRTVYQLLANFLNNPVEINLSLTQILSHLILFNSDPVTHHYLTTPFFPIDPSQPTIFRLLSKVGEQAKEIEGQTPNFEEQYSLVKHTMLNDSSFSQYYAKPGGHETIENIIIWKEFCKDVASIIQIKEVFASLSQN